MGTSVPTSSPSCASKPTSSGVLNKAHACFQQDVASEGYATSDNESSLGEGEGESEDPPPAAAGSDDEIDMEDLGGRTRSGKTATTSQAAAEQQDPREMLTSALRANLSKQGYKLIGTAPPPRPSPQQQAVVHAACY